MIIAFTGAGISKASGIDTFDEQPGIRDKLTRTFARIHPDEYNYTIQNMWDTCKKANPNDAHLALAEYNVPIITMNIDELHQRAGSENVLAIHGKFPNIVLYGDPAPNYSIAHDWVDRLIPGDIFLVVGTSYYTVISEQLRISALSRGAEIVEINADAEHEVRRFLESRGKNTESFEEFMSREYNY